MRHKYPITDSKVLHIFCGIPFSGLDDLRSWCQQDSVGVRFGPEDPIAVVEVVGEGFGDLVRAAVLIILTSLDHQLRRDSFTVVYWV